MTLPSPVLKTFLCVAITAALVQNSFGIGWDLSFGVNGMLMTTFSDTGSPSSSGSEVFLQPVSGRILVIGSHSEQGTPNRTTGFGIAGIASNGTLEAGFGNGGRVLAWSPISNVFKVNSVVLSDGSILVLHRADSGSSSRPAITKYSPDGIFDPTYSPDLDLVPNQTLPVRISQAAGGKILALVRIGDNHSLIRLNPNGSRDTTFGTNGVRSVPLNRFATQPRVFATEELPNGKLIIAGSHNSQFDTPMFVARFDQDTNLDRSFGLQGAVRITVPYATAYGVTMKVQPDGKLLIGGAWTFLGSYALLLRLTTRGRFDGTFGDAGIVRTAFSNWNVINGMAIAPDGTIFVTGSCGLKAVPTNQQMFLIRYTSTGTMVDSLVTNFITGREAGGNDIVLQADGRLVVAGFTQSPSNNNQLLTTARFNQ